MDSKEKPSYFHKKIYKLERSPLSSSIGTETISQALGKDTKSDKVIIPTLRMSGLREEFKKTFLPLLIDIFELRQMVENYKAQQSECSLFTMGKMTQSPQEVLEKLEEMQKDVEESQRWCNGVILQIAKGIEEAKEALNLVEKPAQSENKPKLSLLKRLLFWRKSA